MNEPLLLKHVESATGSLICSSSCMDAKDHSHLEGNKTEAEDGALHHSQL